MARAFDLRRAFARLELKASALATTVDRLAAGVVVLDPDARPIHANAAARLFATREDGLSLDRLGHLRARDRAADAKLSALRRSVLENGAGGIVRVPRDVPARPYVVLVSPLPAGIGFIGAVGEGRSGTLLLVHDPDATMPLPEETLAAAFGLTQRAAELTAALVAGVELKDYADAAGLTRHTARFHLKGAFARLGVRSQAELVRLAVRALADLRG